MWSPTHLNLVLEGGGVRGIALVGALQAIEEALRDKYTDTSIAYMAGTSAGAIVATLAAAGYSPKELADIIGGPVLGNLSEPHWIGRLLDRLRIVRDYPAIRQYVDLAIKLPRIVTRLGLLTGDYFEEVMRDLLRQKGIRTFADLKMPGCERHEEPSLRYRVHLIASDITRGHMLTLPDDMNLQEYGVEPDELDVARAVRMSVSVPGLFEPVRCVGMNQVESYIVDGGLLSNFPIALFDRLQSAPLGTDLMMPRPLTLGVRILRDRYHPIRFPRLPHALYALVDTALEAHDVSDISKAVDELKWARAVEVNTEAVSIFRFNLSPLQRELLYDAGYNTMRRFIDTGLVERATTVHQIAAGAERRVRDIVPRIGTPVSSLGR